MITTVIFDLDLTIIDSLEACTKGANMLAERCGLPKTDKETVIKYISLATPDFWQALWGVSQPDWMVIFNEEIIPLMTPLIKPYPGALDFLDHLRLKGYRLGLATNRVRPWIDLAQMDLAKYFDTAVGTSDTLKPKPQPDILLAALNQLGSASEEAIFIGDSISDMAAAKNAGLRAVGLLQGGCTPEDLTRAGAWTVRRDLPSSGDLFMT
ncbi:MAG: HAD family hydrolase [Deltaproteobacteria bacterium]|jgi:HAD superfamily hydrolase (TIGR01509 family)|nr:HAD family hydrolase [Deltaproteobacteria bacterium]